MPIFSFEPDFADPTEWARMYRAAGLQVVPAMTPSENRQQWKRPALPKWRALEHELAPDLTFERWYGESGEHARRNNMGMITGACSGGAFMLDLDMHKNPAAAQWWRGVLALHNMGGEVETPSQITGGGGLQILFRAPANWTPPTCKTSIGVDVRGQGGFAMLPPSMHESGTPYRWAAGLEPWEVTIAPAPKWLCDEIDALVKEHGGSTSSSGPTERTQTPEAVKDGFGRRLDGREDYATRMIWARVIDEYRQCPIKPGKGEQEAMMKELFINYDRAVRARIPERGTPNHILLEREGRGISMFRQKWKAAFDQWEDKVAKHADAPPPKKDGPKPSSTSSSQASGQAEGEPKGEPDADDPTAEFREDFNVFEVLDVVGIKTLPDPAWLVKGIVIEDALGFIFGAPGCGKSFIALGQALSLASGQPDWWGRSITRNGPVIYISSEGVGDLKFRLRAWELATGVNVDEAPFFLIRESINFMLESDIDRLIRTVQTVVDKTGALPAAIYVDTVSRVLPGADENLQKDMTLFIAACDAVRQKFSATVIGIHHTSRSGNMRGSTVFDGAGDFLLHVERTRGDDVGFLTAHKIKAAQDGWRQAFELKKVSIGTIMSKASLVALACDPEISAGQLMTPAKRLEILEEIYKAATQNEVSGTYAPYSPSPRAQDRWAGWLIMKCLDCTKQEAGNILKELIKDGALLKAMFKKNSKRREMLRANVDELVKLRGQANAA